MKRKTLKKLLACSLTAVVAVGLLAGCGGSGSSSSSSDDTSDESSAAESSDSDETDSGDSSGSDDTDSSVDDTSSDTASSADGGDVGEVTFIMALRDEFLSSLEDGMNEAADELGVKVTTQDAQSDSSKVIQYVETAATAGQEAVIVNMVDPETAEQVVDAAGDMYVVFVNRYPADDSVLNDKVVYVGSDETEAGGFQADYLADYFEDQGEDSFSYILLNGTLGQTNTTLRTESLEDGLAERGMDAEQATAPLAADFDRATAQDMIAPLLTTIDYDAIVSNNDAMALGAIEAMESAGLDPSSIPIVGIDATVDGLQAIKDGTLAMTVFQDAEGQGQGAIHAVVNLINGDPINEGTDFEISEDNDSVVWVPFEPVTKENVDDYD